MRIVPHVGAERAADFAGAQTVVFDILRATTTMAVAFERGVDEIVTAPSIAAARQLKAELPTALLGGEENRYPPSGFDYGNSPAQYSRAELSGRSLILATTNGTRALAAAAHSSLLLAASFRNLGATIRALDVSRPVVLFAAGVKGEEAVEDLLAAGAVASLLAEGGAGPGEGVAPLMALWEAARPDLPAWLAATPNGRWLADGGLAADIAWAAQVDACPHAIVVREGRARRL